ncbi:AsmA family protein [Pseudodesulfovibrio sp. JC047]|uniref:AsmA family protein n=1 Tax=Pseudodesulfovibrio sp. JC047 TaxID=2683199 RepID=UPI0013D2C229|nr:AsmA family protein [Pseudodesulfovibrio sp. JC047]
MRAAIRRLFLLLLELCVILVLGLTIAVFWASYYIDTANFRTAFVEKIETLLDRKVELTGELDIVAWPDLALEVKGLRIEESPDFGSGIAADFETVRILVSVLPLLSKQLKIESVVLDGMTGTVLSDEQGRLNWQSLFTTEMIQGDDSSSVFDGWRFSVETIEIFDADILYRDSASHNEYRLSGLNLNTGIFKPDEDVSFTVSSTFSLEEYGLLSELTLKGRLRVPSDGATVLLRDASIYATLTGDFMPEGAAPGQMTGFLDVDWDNRSVGVRDLQVLFLGLRAEGNIQSGNLSQGLSAEGHVIVHPFTPAEVIARHAPSLPVKDVQGLESSALTSFIRISETGIHFDNLALTLDDLIIRGALNIEGYADPVFDFSMRTNALDLDRYLPLFVTGTPFVWGDFHLDFFRQLRAKGVVRAEALTILDTTLADVRLKVSAQKGTLAFGAQAARPDGTTLNGTLDVVVGKSSQTGVPTLALESMMHVQSSEDGFAELQGPLFALGGLGKCSVTVSVPPLPCPPRQRSILILRAVRGQIDGALDKGSFQYTDASKQNQRLEYSSVSTRMTITPAAGTSETQWNSAVDASVRLRGGTDIESLAVLAQGPLSVGIEDGRVMSSGMAVNGHVLSSVLPRDAKRLTANGTIAFDSEEDTLSVVDGFVRVLETSLKGSVQVRDLTTTPKGTGTVELSGVNPKRIVYLLANKALRTRDGTALTNVDLKTPFSFDEKGFSLTNVRAEFDGMPIQGRIDGAGFIHPMLTFSLSAGAFDLDRYLPPPRQPNSRTGVVPKAEPVDLPLAFFQALRLDGKVAFESFTLAAIRTTRLTGRLKADAGNIHVANVRGQTYGGALTGDWKGTVSSRALSTDLLLDVRNMQAGPFMTDVADRDYIRGQTDISFALKSRGVTDDSILANLDGMAKLQITNGSFKFTGYGGQPDQVSTQRTSDTIRTKRSPQPSARTSFRRATSEYSVKRGVFTAQTWRVEAPPVLQSYGKGGFSLPDNTIDLSIRNDFVAVPSVTLKLIGKLTDPAVRIPTGRIVHDTVFNILSIPEKSFQFLRDLF